MSLKFLILVRQIHERGVLFVTNDSFDAKDLGFNQMLLMPVMIC